jgi:isopenicillin N synthase-like dioxygenase
MGSVSESEPNKVSPHIPIVDLSPFTSPPSADASSDARFKAAQDLVRACREVGFVYIKNHGVPQAELDKAFALSKQFYDLPTEEKMKAPHPSGWAVHRGYSWPGLEKVSGALSEKDDDEWVKNLREVQDYKVWLLNCMASLRWERHHLLFMELTHCGPDRRATKSAPKTIPTNPTSGHHQKSYQNGAPS